MRSALARKEVTKVMREVYRKDFDPDSGDYYYTNVRTNEVRWDNPAEALSLIKAEDAAPELGPDSQLIVSKDSEIERLKKEVEDAKREAYEAKTSTHAKLDKDLRLERMANALKGQKRSRHFDEWRNEHIVAWFLEMDLEEYVPAVLASKVDGLLLLNMDEDDFRELGITKRLHQRKIDIALKKYKLRYERREAGGDDDIDIQAEEVEGDMDESDKSSSEESYSDSDEEEEKTKEEAIVEDGDDLLPTEEELLELKRDRDNIQIDVLFPGDEETYPQIGDVVRCHYVCKIADTGKEVENTRKAKQTFEFVLGIGQVIKGWDRGVLQMSFGERSKLTISAEYAYGEHGVKPLIPPYAKLIFDLELLRWHPRPHWSKPLIQQPGLTEYPYEDPRAAEEEAGDDDEFADLEDDEVDGGDLNASDKMSSLLAKG
jgi:FK506-binding protein 1